MKKLLIWLFCVAMLVSVTACGDETGTNLPGTTETTAPSETETTTKVEDATTSTTATAPTTTGKDGTTSGTKKPTGTKVPQAPDNQVDWEQFFGDDTTTTGKDDTTTTKKPTTTTTTAPTTTQKPTVIDKVTLPAVGTDVDGRGRIAVSKVELTKGVLTLKVRNNTDKQTQKWITEETNYITYACYDKDGKVLTSKDAMYGYFYIGCLEAGQEIEFKVTLPAGTAKVELTGAKIVYWTPWS